MSRRADNPPRRECRQCWRHAYASGEMHAGLGPREDCGPCVDHMINGCPDHLIVK